MVVISFLLVIVAAVTLVVGLFQDGIQWIWASIASCVLAMIFLGIGVLQRRSAPVAAGEDDEGEYAPGALSSLMGREPDRVEPEAEPPPEYARDEDIAVVPTRTSPPATAVTEVDQDVATTPAEPAEEAPAPVAKEAAKKATREEASAKAAAKKATKKSAEKATTKKAAMKQAAMKQARRTTGAAARTELAQVKGLGEAKIEALLEEFKSLEAVRDASVEELTAVKGIGEAIAERIREEL